MEKHDLRHNILWKNTIWVRNNKTLGTWLIHINEGLPEDPNLRLQEQNNNQGTFMLCEQI